jgi:hypothetical protein
MFETHPTTAGRRDQLLQAGGDAGGITGEDRYRKVIAPLRLGWLQDEVKRGQYEESLVMFDRMLAKEPGDAEVLYARGEVHRLRDDAGDLDPARSDLDDGQPRAQGAGGKPSARWGWCTGSATTVRRRSRLSKPTSHRRPQAPDAAMVRSYLAELK